MPGRVHRLTAVGIVAMAALGAPAGGASEVRYEELVTPDELLVVLRAISRPSDGRLAAGTPTAVAGLKRT
jgi:hypothetical protein